MLKRLKERQLGNTLDRKTISDQISRYPKFEHSGKISYHGQISDPNVELVCCDLKWTSDGDNLVSLMSEFVNNDFKRQKIAIWENPNTDTKQRVKSQINLDLGQFADKLFLDSLEIHGKTAILGGYNEERTDDADQEPNGRICLISLSTCEVEEVIRIGFIRFHFKFKMK